MCRRELFRIEQIIAGFFFLRKVFAICAYEQKQTTSTLRKEEEPAISTHKVFWESYKTWDADMAFWEVKRIVLRELELYLSKCS